MVSAYKWHISGNRFAYLANNVPNDTTTKYIITDEYTPKDESIVSDKVNKLEEDEYKYRYSLMSSVVKQSYGMDMLDYTYYYNIDEGMCGVAQDFGTIEGVGIANVITEQITLEDGRTGTRVTIRLTDNTEYSFAVYNGKDVDEELLQQIEDSISGLTDSAVSLSSSVEDLDERVSALEEGTITDDWKVQVDASLNTLSLQTSTISGNLDNCNSRVSANTANINSLSGSVISLNQSVERVGVSATTALDRVTAVNNRVNTLNNELSEIIQDVNELDQTVASIIGSDSGITEQLSDIRNSINANTNSIVSLSNDISNLSSRTNSIDARLSGISNSSAVIGSEVENKCLIVGSDGITMKWGDAGLKVGESGSTDGIFILTSRTVSSETWTDLDTYIRSLTPNSNNPTI